ncbi:oleoyl-coa acyltransferase [Anaeramoeba flamelloides]|uniref:Oleoyl-coa acyltransferase n=1 Tax=Anaeramoeba flamelloides TaxID=1746091 RepID=A0AAV7ZN95_9EUKA|nr:oleoyl-coa acyltransferase [Anaeramoeba flamelloides]
MEVISNWSDKLTGVEPFLQNRLELPPAPKNYFLIFYLLRYYFLYPIIGVIRMALIVIVFLWLCVVTFLAEYPLSWLSFSPIIYLKRGFKRYSLFIGCRSLLFIMGYFWIDTQVTGKKNTESSQRPLGLTFGSGDLIIANKNSIAEILYLAFRCAPQFTAIPNYWEDGQDYPGEDGKVRKRNVVTCILGLLFNIKHTRNDEIDSADKYIPLTKLLKQSKKRLDGPVVVFPEGISTNGSGMLEFLPIFEDSNLDRKPPKRIILLGFKYKGHKDQNKISLFNPSFSYGNPLKYLLSLCYAFRKQFQVKIINQKDIPKLPIFKPNNLLKNQTFGKIETKKEMDKELMKKKKQNFKNLLINNKKNENYIIKNKSERESESESENQILSQEIQDLFVWSENVQESLCNSLKIRKTRFLSVHKYKFLQEIKKKHITKSSMRKKKRD